MIYDRLENASFYYALHPLFRNAFEALQKTDWNQAEYGRHDIEGDALFINFAHYQTKIQDQCAWEAHRRYIDIQLMVEGEEKMGHAFQDTLQIKQPYASSQDVEFYSGQGQLITFAPNTFAIYFPHDAHQPGVMLDAPGSVRKAVAKIQI